MNNIVIKLKSIDDGADYLVVDDKHAYTFFVLTGRRNIHPEVMTKFVRLGVQFEIVKN